ncbi:E3 ubiquitin/ISG15 ligase TRIM25 isoform X1 [Takifugu flavidus]|uniref:E3 ubiquitin/ISG15 ligase TRIM25 isoform X1 n=1 Tax=Takifugu flavidus TaxID=433684 RepID=UPI00254430A9|nr:E3 ubiquitin/ISG15 ligase TRIM25 isoform X1 [Takifugu flavidus]
MAGLLQLEEDLSCSICLSTFDCPVTVPCGHNFCNNCLLLTWADCSSFSCPQCRAVFPTRPDLKKNTVLSTIVESFSSKMADKTEAKLSGEPTKVEKDGVILCDTCMETEASKTCLTCMASFCEEHLKPHRMNPVFSLHPLVEPVRNLFEWTCQNHHKLMEFFCSQHGQVICSLCLQQDHKGCSFISAEKQRNLKKEYFKDQLDFLDKKRVQNEKVISEMSTLPESLQNSATSTKKALAAEYQRIRDMLTQEEQNALLAVDHEVQNGHVKIKTLMKKFTSNISTISKAKEHIQSVLKEPQTLAFLQASFDLPSAAKFDPHTPRINLDSPNVKLSKDFATSLNQFLTESFKMTPEARLGRLKTAGVAEEKSTSVPPAKAAAKKNKQMKKDLSKSMENLLNMKEMLSGLHVASASKLGAVLFLVEGPQEALDITSVKDRHELLKYARTLTLDRTTANKRIVMSDGFTRATVADQPLNYPNCPQRFTVCSQVLGSTGFNTGRHYWEVLLSSNNFIGIGLTYQDIDRGGLSSRLGRNSVSWCIEWLNNKLSAWHDTNETVLENTHPKCVGVLLDCEGGTATFYNVAHKATPFHSFVFHFAKAVYPAFWVFPGGSSLSLRRL